MAELLRGTVSSVPPSRQFEKQMYASFMSEEEWELLLQRYRRDNATLDASMEKSLYKKLTADVTDNVESFMGLEQALRYLRVLPFEVQVSLIDAAIAARSCSVDLAQHMAAILPDLSPDRRTAYEGYIEKSIKNAIEFPLLLVSRDAVELIASLPKDRQNALYALARHSLLEEAQSTDPLQAENAIASLSLVPGTENDQERLIHETLKNSPDVHAVCSAIECVAHLPDNLRGKYYKEALDAFNRFAFQNDPTSKDPFLVLDALDVLPPEVLKALDVNVHSIIQRTFSDILTQNAKVETHLLRRVIHALAKLPSEYSEQLMPEAFSVLQKIFQDTRCEPFEKCDIVEFAAVLPAESFVEVVKLALKDSVESVRMVAAMQFKKLPTNMAQSLEQSKSISVPPNPLRDAMTEGSLLSEVKKTGADLTVIGGKFADKVIVRTFPIDRYLYWRKAFEASDVWKRHGYTYVPIEPILGVKKADKGINSDGTFQDVRVFAGVTGSTNVREWLAHNTRHASYIGKEMEKIIKILSEDLGIMHGHPHPANFVLAFPLGSDNTPNYEALPRVYMIDFDLAQEV